MRSNQSTQFTRDARTQRSRTFDHRRRTFVTLACVCTLATAFGLTAIDRASAQSQDPQVLLDLAKRALSQNGEVTLEPGVAPTITPALATPAGWKLVGTVSVSFPGAPRGFENRVVHYDATGNDPSAAMDALLAALTPIGWKPMDQGPNPGGGFVPAESVQPVYRMLCGGARFLNATAQKPKSGAVMVAVNVASGPEGAPTPCSQGAGGPVTTIPSFAFENPYAQLPRLALPSTAKLLFGGGGGGSMFSASSNVLVEESKSTTELVEFFASQMTTAGWLADGAPLANARLAASTWKKSVTRNGKTTDFQAMLTVATAVGATNRRELVVSVSGPIPEGFENGSFPFGPPPMVAPTIPIAASAPDTMVALQTATAAQSAGGFAAPVATKAATTKPAKSTKKAPKATTKNRSAKK